MRVERIQPLVTPVERIEKVRKLPKVQPKKEATFQDILDIHLLEKKDEKNIK